MAIGHLGRRKIDRQIVKMSLLGPFWGPFGAFWAFLGPFWGPNSRTKQKPRHLVGDKIILTLLTNPMHEETTPSHHGKSMKFAHSNYSFHTMYITCTGELACVRVFRHAYRTGNVRERKGPQLLHQRVKRWCLISHQVGGQTV